MKVRTARHLPWFAVAAALLLMSLTGAAAESAAALGPVPAQTAWWWQAESSSSPTRVPPPSVVSPGELYLNGAATGTTAFPAIRYLLTAPLVKPALTLHVAPKPCQPGQPTTSACRGDTGGEYAALLACRTGSPWTAQEAGSWEEKPLIDGDHCTDGLRSADGWTWVFDLTSVAAGTLIDIAIVPGTGQTAPLPVELVFTAPQAGDLSARGEGGSGASTPPTAGPQPTADPSARVQPRPGSAGSSRVPGSSPPPSIRPIPALPPDALVAPLTEQAAAVGAQPDESAAAALPVVDVSKPAHWSPLLLLLLATIGGIFFAWWRWSQPSRVATEDGLGRFVAPREGLPPTLR
jgi:hypothetical protein